MTAKIYLIGTSHFDFEGEKRLWDCLTDIDANIVFVEGAKDHMERVQPIQNNFLKISKKRLKSLNREDIIPFLERSVKNHSYELKGCENYTEKTKKQLIYLDDSKCVDKCLELLQSQHEVIFKLMAENINILSQPAFFSPNIDVYYTELEQEIQYEIPPPPPIFIDEYILGERDTIFEQKIRPVAEKNDGKLAVVVGAGHILSDFNYKRTLYEKIKDLNPERLNLGRY